MSISIVIVTYNSSKQIFDLLQSVSEQTNFKNIKEVIIIDNNSQDKNNLVKLTNRNDFRKLNIKLFLRKKNYGFGKSSNYGALHSKSKYILFLNPDTKLEQNSISILLEHLKIFNGDIIGGLAYKQNNFNIHRSVFNTPNLRTFIFEYSNLGKIFKINSGFYVDQTKIKDDYKVGGVSGAYLLVKKDIFYKLNMFDEHMFMYLEDVDFCARANNKNYKIIYCPHSRISHIGGSSSNNKYKINQEAWYSSREYYAYKTLPKYLSMPLILFYKIEHKLLMLRSELL